MKNSLYFFKYSDMIHDCLFVIPQRDAKYKKEKGGEMRIIWARNPLDTME